MKESLHADLVRIETLDGHRVVAFGRTSTPGVIDRHLWLARHPATGRLHVEYNDPSNTADEGHLDRVVLASNTLRLVFKGPRLLPAGASPERIDELLVCFAPDPARPLADAMRELLGADVPLEVA